MPVPLGAVKLTFTELESTADTAPMVGGLGNVVNEVDVDNVDVPPELVAVIVNVYILFEVNPVKLTGKVEDVPYVVLPERSFTL
jgi:hypothetical protein